MVKFADTQKDKEQRRLQQQLAQQMQQLNSATTWGSLTGLGGLTPQYLAVRRAARLPLTTPTPPANAAEFERNPRIVGPSSCRLPAFVLLFFWAPYCSPPPPLVLRK